MSPPSTSLVAWPAIALAACAIAAVALTLLLQVLGNGIDLDAILGVAVFLLLSCAVGAWALAGDGDR